MPTHNILRMNEVSYVVVFPTAFSKRHIRQLIKNIKNVLKIKGQQYKSVEQDGDVIRVHANDPVFASSALSLLYGIEKVAIARCIKNNFDDLVKEISFTGGNLLLEGERFLVRVEGDSNVTSGFLTGDVEIASTSKIIEERSGVRPGTVENHDKMLYTYLTKENAYVSIFMDQGAKGVVHEQREEKTTCAVYDEISAISCLETIKQGHDIQIMVFYRRESELIKIVRMINRIIPRLLKEKVELEFFNLNVPTGARGYPVYLRSILEVMLQKQNRRISLALSPLLVSAEFTDGMIQLIFKAGKIPVLPLAGVEDTCLFADAKDIGLEGPSVSRLKKAVAITTTKFTLEPKDKQVQHALKSNKKILITIGPNNVHDILDSLEYKI